MLIRILLVALGGALGSTGRYLTGEAIKATFGTSFPLGTLVVNIAGCAAIGFLIPYWTGSHAAHLNARLLLVTGILGGFTTFSAFGLETHTLFMKGQTTWALANIALNVIVGLAAVGVGARLGRAFI
jgi:CrcB protein